MSRRNKRGMALVTMMVVMGLLMAIGAAIHTGVMADTEMHGAHGRALNGFYAAEAGINRGMGDYRNIFLSYQEPSGSDFDLHSFTLGPRTVNYQLSSVPGNPTVVTVPAGQPFAGLNAIEYKYTANATSQLTAGDVEASLGTEFDVDYIPLFQFLAFYAGDLEILPGANMTLNGPIHTNGSLYLNASGATLTIAELLPDIPSVYVSAAGDIVRRRKDDPSTCSGTVSVAKLVDANHNGALDLQAVNCSGVVSNATLATWLGSMKSRQPTVSVPTPDVIARGSGLFWQQSNLRIALMATTPDATTQRLPIVALDVNGAVDGAQTARLQSFMQQRPGRIFYNDTPRSGWGATGACAGGALNPGGASNTYCNQNAYVPAFDLTEPMYACGASDLGLYPCGPSGSTDPIANPTSFVRNKLLSGSGSTVTARRAGFFNNRENAWVKMLNVNVHDLLAWNALQASGDQFFAPDTPVNGGVVIFLSVVDASSAGVGNPRLGVRVFGSPGIGQNGVTIVSDQGVYVEGDYNTGAVPGEPWRPSSILGDTINVLSRTWSGTLTCRNDCQSRQSLANRPVSANTTINAAFISGVDVSALGNYNGGLENYPRFHESWTGRTLQYRGSFVSLGTPRHNNGAWCGTGGACNIYDPPVRNFNYDARFQQVANLPPLTPRFVSVKQILFTENFR